MEQYESNTVIGRYYLWQGYITELSQCQSQKMRTNCLNLTLNKDSCSRRIISNLNDSRHWELLISRHYGHTILHILWIQRMYCVYSRLQATMHRTVALVTFHQHDPSPITYPVVNFNPLYGKIQQTWIIHCHFHTSGESEHLNHNRAIIFYILNL